VTNNPRPHRPQTLDEYQRQQRAQAAYEAAWYGEPPTHNVAAHITYQRVRSDVGTASRWIIGGALLFLIVLCCGAPLYGMVIRSFSEPTPAPSPSYLR